MAEMMKRARSLCVGVGLGLAGTACGSTEHNPGARGADTGGAATGGANTAGAATAGGSAGNVPVNDGTYVIEFSEPDQPAEQPGLFIRNETLAVALTRGPAVREFSRAAPGDVTPADVVLQYTRIGCDIEDPEDWLDGAALTPVPGTQLIRVTITQHDDLTDGSSALYPLQLADDTCLSVRLAGGAFRPLTQYSTVLQLGDASSEVAFDVSASSVDAFALFLPTYTRVSRVSYTIPPL